MDIQNDQEISNQKFLTDCYVVVYSIQLGNNREARSSAFLTRAEIIQDLSLASVSLQPPVIFALTSPVLFASQKGMSRTSD